jgi:hypothetical protein
MAKNANLLFRLKCKLKSIFYITSKNNYKTPIIINSYNRLKYLKQLISWLENNNYDNIYIIDNDSNFAPLLEYYKTLPYTIFRLNKNVGHLSLWKTHVFQWFKNDYYVYTDPDILPISECPNNIIEHFKNALIKHPEIGKVGFSLLINDLPDHYDQKSKVIEWERQYWETEIEPNLFKAKIDTTFALYRPGSKGGWENPAIRTSGKYSARHLPWYENSCQPDEEELFFIQNSNQSSSWYNRNNIYDKT